MFLISPQLFLTDLLLLLCLLVGCTTTYVCINFLYNKKSAKIKRGVLSTFGVCAFICTISLLYGICIEPYRITITEHKIYTSKHVPLRIAMISDIHVRPGKNTAFLQKVVAQTNTQKPDVVLLLGDYIFDWRSDVAPLLELKNLQSTYGTFAILGNHDQGEYQRLNGERISEEARVEDIIAVLNKANVRILRNESVQLQVGGNMVQLAGIDDWWARPDVTTTLQNVNPNLLTILLSHNPSVIRDPRTAQVDIVTSGHTHAGQIRLPWYGSIKTLPTSLGKAYDQGIFTINAVQTLAITRGVGESLMRVRFLAPPEIMVLDVE